MSKAVVMVPSSVQCTVAIPRAAGRPAALLSL
jgi:hypothetical protein